MLQQNTRNTISYDAMLAQIAAGSSVPYRIRYVIGQGKHVGEIREKVVYYGTPNPLPRSGNAPKSDKKTYLKGGLIPFTEFESGKLETLFSYNIIYFNGKKVIC
jgi:hypothetical protein